MNCIYIIFLLIILFLLMNIYENIDFCNINTCKNGYILKDNICVNCPPVNNVYDEFSYDSNCNPNKCKDGIKLVNNVCDSECSNKLNVERYKIGCYIDKCVNNYMVIDNGSNCVCNSIVNSKIVDSNCNVTACNNGYQISSDKKNCILSCNTGKKLSNGICLTECPENQVNINNICTTYIDEYIFTNCDAVGNTGPTINQCNNYYNNTNLKDKIQMETTRQGIQIWIVPKKGRYHITSAGAGIIDNYENCRGVIISSVFDLNQGDKIKILVGQSGSFSTQAMEKKLYGYLHGSGSGGTFVIKFINDNDYTKENNIPLIISGGGGGKYYGNEYSYVIDNRFFYVKKDYSNASYTTSGYDNINYIKTGGINGNGGLGDFSVNNGYGGGGFYTDGGKKQNDIRNCNGKSFLNGGNGGLKYDYVYNDGGFGGGTASFSYSGSGGGYSGGASNSSDASTLTFNFGYGGGSYCLNTMENLGYNNGMGYVNIKYLGQ